MLGDCRGSTTGLLGYILAIIQVLFVNIKLFSFKIVRGVKNQIAVLVNAVKDLFINIISKTVVGNK